MLLILTSGISKENQQEKPPKTFLGGFSLIERATEEARPHFAKLAHL